MGQTATYNIPHPRTVRVTAVAVARGARLIENANGLYSLANTAAARGDCVALQDIPASGSGAAAFFSNGGSVPMLAGEAANAGDAAYAMAGGVGVTSVNAVLVGRFKEAAEQDKLAIVEIKHLL